jgi:hypothetical protein
MALEISSLSELSTTSVEQIRETLAQLLQEANPALDLKRGVLHDLLLHYSSLLAAGTQENIDKLRRSSSLLEIEADPTLADDDVVDAVLSNYRVTRQTGQKATGSVTIVVSALATTTVENGAVFTANGKEYRSNASYVARTTSGSTQSATDKVLTSLGDGTYAFTITVTAAEVGSASQLTKNTLLIPSSAIVNFVKAYATSDFADGTDTETNAEMLSRLQTGIACKALSNRVNMLALLQNEPAFSGIVASSIIGYGDAEMIRDQHSLFPVSYGGRADWYLRTQALPQQVALTKTAALVSVTPDGVGTWQFSISRDDAPGFYDITAIQPPSLSEITGGFEITYDVRGADLAPLANELTPDIEDPIEGVYSRYQTAIIRFVDTLTDASSLALWATQDYSVTVRYMPLLDDIQSFVNSREYRNYAGDVLIKAAIPCFVSLSFSLEGYAGEALPDPEAIKDDLVDHVNSLGFCGRLYASELADRIHNFLSGRVAVSKIDMFGQIRKPDNTVENLRSTEVLTIPYLPDDMVSSRTVTFVLSRDDIAISARTVNSMDVV